MSKTETVETLANAIKTFLKLWFPKGEARKSESTEQLYSIGLNHFRVCTGSNVPVDELNKRHIDRFVALGSEQKKWKRSTLRMFLEVIRIFAKDYELKELVDRVTYWNRVLRPEEEEAETAITPPPAGPQAHRGPHRVHHPPRPQDDGRQRDEGGGPLLS